MKKVFILLALFFCSTVFAGDYITLYCENITTNAGGITTNAYSHRVSGEVEGVMLYWSGTVNATGDVDVVSTDAGASKLAQTIFSADAVTGDHYYPVRLNTVTTGGVAASTTNDYAKIQLIRDYVELRVGNINTTNVNCRALVLLKK